VDLLCLGNFAHNLFFEVIQKALTDFPDIKIIRVVEDAVVPIIKLKVKGIDVDVQYAKMLSPITNFDWRSISPLELRKLDKKSLRSFNGLIDTEIILKSVPNRETFITILKFVKYWALKRGIYSQIYGYFGGVGWTLLVARLCQEHPQGVPISQLIGTFFQTYSTWNWKTSAVTLHMDPPILYKIEKHDFMPIVTPSKPHKNSARHVTISTKQDIQSELSRAATLSSPALSQNPVNWISLVEERDFFSCFKIYLKLIVSADTETEFFLWAGWIESKLIHLIIKLEHHLITALPFTGKLLNTKSPYLASWIYFVGFSVPDNLSTEQRKSIDLASIVREFESVVNNWEIKTDGMHLKITQTRRNGRK